MLINNPALKRLLLFIPILFFNLFLFSQTTINSEDFNSGFGTWNDGGNNCELRNDNSPNNTQSVRLFDDATSSRVTSNSFDLTSYTSINFSFEFETDGIEDNQDIFQVQFSNNGGANWLSVASYTKNVDYNNNGTVYYPSITVSNSSPTTFTNNSVFRIIMTYATSTNDRVYLDNILITGISSSSCAATGNILLEQYDGIAGTSITNLISAPNYPNSPTITSLPTSFEAPTNIGDNYGVRMRGTVCAPETGTYYFWVAGDDNVELNLSTDNTEANKVQIAYHNGWTNSREWNKFVTQKSVGIILTAGQSYYIEALMKEGVGGDNLAVGWRIPSDGNATSPAEVVPGSYLSPPTTPLTEGPGGVTNNLALWLKADANVTVNGSNGVTVWGDNGRGSDAVVNTTGQEPTLRDNATYNINFNPVVDFDNNATESEDSFDYTELPQQYLEGASGFYTHEIFMVVIPDQTVNSTFGAMDLFCSDSNVSRQQNDATGIGFGAYSQRFSGEVLSYAYALSSGLNSGFGVAQTGSYTYNNIGIINTRNNTSSNGQELYYNANNIVNTTSEASAWANITNGKFWIGRSEGWRASLDGRVTEIITYSSRQNDANLTQERNRIQSYLAIKYGITLGVNGTSQDYVDSNGTVIWDQSANSGFSYDIAGIGRDDDSGLNQKQSKSVNPTSVVTIGYGDIAATNSANTNNLTADRDFLVWGHNNAALSGSDVLSINLGASATSVTTMFDRRWKIVESRPTGGNDILDVKVSIPNAILPSISANEEYALIVSSTATFGSGDIVDVIPLKANGSNFETWYDFDNTKYFTFGIATRVTGKYNVEFSTGDFLVGENTVNLNSNFTVSAWVRNLGNGGTYVSKGTAYDFKLNTSGNVEVYTNGTLRATSTETINDAIWHHIAITNNGSNLLIYIDGVLDTTSASVSPSATTDKFAIGVVYTTKNNISTPFHGDIDEIRIWDTVLTQAQIQYIMNQEIEDDSNNVNGTILPQTVTLNAVSSIPWNTIKAYHNINSFYGTTVEDASNNNNHVRIKYLTIGKDIIDNQSAPLPYISSSNGNWDTSGTWTNGSELYIPNTAGLDGTIINWNIVETNTNVNTTRDVTVLGLVNSLNELSINADNKLEVSHYLKIDGVIDLDGESQLIQTTDSDFDTSSTGNLERDQQGVGNKFRYNDWSSPVSSNASTSTYTVASVLKDGTDANNPININFVGGYNGDNTTTPIQIANYWIYKYANDDHDNYSKWNQIGSTGPLKAGEGYLMKGTANPGVLTDQNYVFVGKPNNGDISLTVAPTNDYLVGNPYPSAIDADAFIIDNVNSIEGGTIYFWEHYGGDSHNLKDYQAGYASYNLSGGVIATSHPINDPLAGPGSKEPQQFIAVGQGFFVQGDADGGDIVFKNSQRAFVTEANPLNSIFLKTSQTKKGETSIEKKGDTRLKIKLALEANSSMRRQLLLTIDERASDAIDWGFDGPIYEEFSEDMYWPIENGKYVIQGTNNLTKDKEIPLVIKSVGGLITIKIDAIENAPENFEVYIKDTTTGETYDILKAGLEIELEAGVYSDKFVITFQPRLKTIDEITLNEGVHIFMNNTTSELQINKILDTQITDVVLYNYLGQTVKTWNTNFEERLTSLPLNMATGAYIVNVNTIDGTITKKIIIN